MNARALARVAAALLLAAAALAAAPARAQCVAAGEWLCHKSLDGLHPDALEQSMLWLMNRARQDPSAEGAFLAAIDDTNVLEAIAFYGVDLGVLQDEFDAIAPKPPAAFDRRLWTAAALHADFMIASNHQDPPCGGAGEPCQLDRVAAAGFFFVASGLRGNSFGFGRSPLFTHAAWNIDWGPFFSPKVPPGMFPGRVHRKGVMSDPDASASQVLTNVGIAAVSTAGQPTELGPVVYVANYANANTAGAPDHYDRFVVGTVWRDLDQNGFYDAGEGVGGVTVTVTPGSFFATTAPGGGYAIPATVAGNVAVAFGGGGVPDFETTAAVGLTDSVLVDYALPEPGAIASSFAALLALGALRRLR